MNTVTDDRERATALSEASRASTTLTAPAEPVLREVDCATRSPGDDAIGGEDGFEQVGVGHVGGDAADGDVRGQRRRVGVVKQDHGDRVAPSGLLLDGPPRDRGGAVLQQVKGAGHQKTSARRAPRASAAMSSAETRTIGWPSAFQSASAGMAAASTWNGTPSRLRFSRNFAMSSPSTRSSVSASSKWTAGPVSTKVTVFSPATTPTPMRMASNARPERRGSAEISTRTGSSVTERARSVQRDEAVGAVDQDRKSVV